MCQMRIVMKENDHEEIVLENAAALTVVDDGIVVNAMFEEPLRIRDAAIDRIDFLENKLTLKRVEKEPSCNPPQRSKN